MTNRYKNGLIYSIRSFYTDKYYIGSTCMPLCKRLYNHRKTYEAHIKNDTTTPSCTAFEILKYEDHYIELVELYACNSKTELERREGEIQRLHKDEIVNYNIAGRTRSEFYADNKEQILRCLKENYNADGKAHKKQYYIDNKAYILEKRKQYYATKKANSIIKGICPIIPLSSPPSLKP